MGSRLFTYQDVTGDYWGVPNNVRQIWVHGAGGGGGGGGSNGATGGSGGGSGATVERMRIRVNPGLPIGVKCGRGRDGGAAGANGEGSSSGYDGWSIIAGAGLADPFLERLGPLYFLSLAHGRSGGANSIWAYAAECIVPERGSHIWAYTNAQNQAKWMKELSSQYGVASFSEGVFSCGDGSRAGPSHPYSYGVSGRITACGKGIGEALASDATYGSGGPGGGNRFARGGSGGQYPGSVNGGDGEDFGAGGGGGANGGTGGRGGHGFWAFEW